MLFDVVGDDHVIVVVGGSEHIYTQPFYAFNNGTSIFSHHRKPYNGRSTRFSNMSGFIQKTRVGQTPSKVDSVTQIIHRCTPISHSQINAMYIKSVRKAVKLEQVGHVSLWDFQSTLKNV
jgi:hypothetical protein